MLSTLKPATCACTRVAPEPTVIDPADYAAVLAALGWTTTADGWRCPDCATEDPDRDAVVMWSTGPLLALLDPGPAQTDVVLVLLLAAFVVCVLVARARRPPTA